MSAEGVCACVPPLAYRLGRAFASMQAAHPGHRPSVSAAGLVIAETSQDHHGTITGPKAVWFGPVAALHLRCAQMPAQKQAGLAQPGPWLVADIGGTNARFGWVATPDGGIEHVVTLACADHAGPAAAAKAYLTQVAPQLGQAHPVPRVGAFAVATAVGGDRIAFTNSGWEFSRRATCAELGLDELRVLNDFEALALALPRLGPTQWRPVGLPGVTQQHAQPAEPGPGCVMAVIGPGTGLGVGAVVATPAGWQALPGEGGHSTLAAGDELESAVLAYLRSHHSHVSAERLLSGIGLPLLHQALQVVAGQPGGPLLQASEIVEYGVSGADQGCTDALETFSALLGSFAGNVALTVGARGGVYIGGGIVPRFEALFMRSRFRERFEAKGRLRPYLEQVPTRLITDTLAALTGAASVLRAPG